MAEKIQAVREQLREAKQDRDYVPEERADANHQYAKHKIQLTDKEREAKDTVDHFAGMLWKIEHER
jgi:uncharacterized protein (DUF3084 family)